jgi:hypothetical protein
MISRHKCWTPQRHLACTGSWSQAWLLHPSFSGSGTLSEAALVSTLHVSRPQERPCGSSARCLLTQALKWEMESQKAVHRDGLYFRVSVRQGKGVRRRFTRKQLWDIKDVFAKTRLTCPAGASETCTMCDSDHASHCCSHQIHFPYCMKNLDFCSCKGLRK